MGPTQTHFSPSRWASGVKLSSEKGSQHIYASINFSPQNSPFKPAKMRHNARQSDNNYSTIAKGKCFDLLTNSPNSCFKRKCLNESGEFVVDIGPNGLFFISLGYRQVAVTLLEWPPIVTSSIGVLQVNVNAKYNAFCTRVVLIRVVRRLTVIILAISPE